MGLYSREHMLETIKARLLEMGKALQVCKIKPEQLTLHPRVEEFDLDFVREAFTWVEQLYHREFYKWREVRELCTEEVWATYDAIGDQDDLREVGMLREVNKTFRVAVHSKNRAGLFKKGGIDEQLKKLLPTEDEERANRAKARKSQERKASPGGAPGKDHTAGRNHRQSRRRDAGDGRSDQRTPGEGPHHS